MLTVTNKPLMLSVIILYAIVLNVALLNVVMLNVVAPCVVMLEGRYAECRYAECRASFDKNSSVELFNNKLVCLSNICFKRGRPIQLEHNTVS
jgi:hypothetical protein